MSTPMIMLSDRTMVFTWLIYIVFSSAMRMECASSGLGSHALRVRKAAVGELGHVSVRIEYLPEYLLIAALAHEHEMHDVHLADARNTHLAVGPIGIFEGKRIAHLDTREVRQAL